MSASSKTSKKAVPTKSEVKLASKRVVTVADIRQTIAASVDSEKAFKYYKVDLKGFSTEQWKALVEYHGENKDVYIRARSKGEFLYKLYAHIEENKIFDLDAYLRQMCDPEDDPWIVTGPLTIKAIWQQYAMDCLERIDDLVII